MVQRKLKVHLPSALLSTVSVLVIVMTTLFSIVETGVESQQKMERDVKESLEGYLVEELGALLADPAVAVNATGVTGLLERISEEIERSAVNRTFRNGEVHFRVVNLSLSLLPIYMEKAPPSVLKPVFGEDDREYPAYILLTGAPFPRGLTLYSHYRVFVQENGGGGELTGEVMFDYYTPHLTAIAGFYSLQRGFNLTLQGYLKEMLNALIRTRGAAGVGMKNGDSLYHLLSPLDLEVALNIALIFWEVEVFGVPAKGSLDALERYFFNVSAGFSLEGEVNPTGFREWSRQEKDLYASYLTRRVTLPDSTERRMSALLKTAGERGLFSPSEMLLLYLVYDRTLENLGITVNPYDSESIFSQRGFANPRDPYSTVDPSSPPWLAAPPPVPDYWENLTGGEGRVGGAEGSTPPPLSVKRTPAYLVMGRDFEVDGFYTPRGWYTDVDLTRNASELINYNNTPTRGVGCGDEETRCGGVPLPPKPPDHDFRVKWEMEIRGKMHYTLSLPGGSTVLERDVGFDFQVSLFAWYQQRPTFPAEEIEFRNINTGGAVQTQNYSMWLITPAANATEYYLKYIWQDLRDLFGWGYLLGRLLEGASMVDTADLPEALISIYTTSLRAIAYGKEKSLSSTYISLKQFMNEYVWGAGLHLSDLGYIEEDSFNMTLSYFPKADVFVITGSLEGIAVRMELYRVITSPEGEVFMEISPARESGGNTVYNLRLPLHGAEGDIPPLTFRNEQFFLTAHPGRLEAVEVGELPGRMLYEEVMKTPGNPSGGVFYANGSVVYRERELFLASRGNLSGPLPQDLLQHYLMVNTPIHNLAWVPLLYTPGRGSFYFASPLSYLLDPFTVGNVIEIPSDSEPSGAFIWMEMTVKMEDAGNLQIEADLTVAF